MSLQTGKEEEVGIFIPTTLIMPSRLCLQGLTVEWYLNTHCISLYFSFFIKVQIHRTMIKLALIFQHQPRHLSDTFNDNSRCMGMMKWETSSRINTHLSAISLRSWGMFQSKGNSHLIKTSWGNEMSEAEFSFLQFRVFLRRQTRQSSRRADGRGSGSRLGREEEPRRYFLKMLT